MKICILTTREISTSARVFYTEAKTLSKKYNLTLIARNKNNIKEKNINIISLSKPKSRLSRFFIMPFQLFNLARKENAVIYHFHDPELIPFMLLLKFIKKSRIIYDCHENYKEKLQSRSWILKPLRNLVSYAYDKFEKTAIRFFDCVLVADKASYSNFKKYKKEVEFIGNFPPIIPAQKTRLFKNKITKCIYIGSLSKERGLLKMIEAINKTNNAILILIGTFENEKDKKILLRSKKTEYLGEKPWPEVFKILEKCDIGLNLLQNVPAYINSGENTTKIFEYMANQLPVISSNFQNLKKIIKENKCGICVKPENEEETAKAISYLAENKSAAKNMGKNGRKAVLKKYNWENEEKKLLNIYKSMEK